MASPNVSVAPVTVPGTSSTSTVSATSRPSPATTRTPTAVSASSFQSMLDQSVQAAITSSIPRIMAAVDARIQAAIPTGSIAGGTAPGPLSSNVTTGPPASSMGKNLSGVALSLSILHSFVECDMLGRGRGYYRSREYASFYVRSKVSIKHMHVK